MGIFEKWRRKKLSLEEQMRLKFRDEFDDCVKSKTVRSGRTGDPMMDGLLVYGAISITYKSLKDNRQLQALNALTILQHGFDPGQILDEELHRALKKYCGIVPPRKDDDLDFLDFDEPLTPEMGIKNTPKVVSPAQKNTPSLEEADIEYNSDRTAIISVKKCPSHFVIPEGVTTIAERAFMGSTSLYSIVLPHSLKRIEENAFCSCSGLQTVKGGDQLEYIGAWAFSWCLNLRGFFIPKTVKEIDSNPFAFTMAGRAVPITTESPRFIVIDDLLIDSQNGIAISYNGMAPTVVLPDCVRYIGDSCFRGADYVKKLVIPKSVTGCDNNPIPMCGIQEIDSASDKLIVRNHFLVYGNTIHAYFGQEESVVIPEGISILAECSFDCMSQMKTVLLPSSIQDVGEEPFRGCDNLETVIVPKGEIARIKSIFPEDFEVEFIER